MDTDLVMDWYIRAVVCIREQRSVRCNSFEWKKGCLLKRVKTRRWQRQRWRWRRQHRLRQRRRQKGDKMKERQRDRAYTQKKTFIYRIRCSTWPHQMRLFTVRWPKEKLNANASSEFHEVNNIYNTKSWHAKRNPLACLCLYLMVYDSRFTILFNFIRPTKKRDSNSDQSVFFLWLLKSNILSQIN